MNKRRTTKKGSSELEQACTGSQELIVKFSEILQAGWEQSRAEAKAQCIDQLFHG